MLERNNDGKAPGADQAGVQAPGSGGGEKQPKPKLTFKRFVALAKAFEYKNFARNFPVWLWLKVRNAVFFWFMRMRVRYWAMKSKVLVPILRKRWMFRMWLAGYKWIHPEEFIKLYPPKKGHKTCNGQGWYRFRRPDKRMMIVMCDCVQQKYKASGKKFLLKELD